MGFPITIHGVVYNEADFLGQGYVTALPAVLTRLNDCVSTYLDKANSTTSVLMGTGAKVFTVEREYDLFLMAREKFDKLGYGIQTKWGDGSIGWNEFAPYDAILVTAGSPSIPEPLKNQLAIGGRLIIPVGERDSQMMVIIHKTGLNEFSKTELPNFAFVPLLGKEGWTKK